MAITGIRSFHYPVNRISESKKFYIEALGFKLAYEQPGWIALEMSGVQVALHPEEYEIPRIPRDAHGAHAGGCLTLASDNVPEDRKKLETYGAKILGEADEPWGHMLTFEDPDGNVLKLMRAKY
jgi:catechol 2,3-dioxygenase-like lactoylglutathione lyase family enzyme